MLVSRAMTHNVRLVTSEQSISDAAWIMADCAIGVLPVGDDDRLVGMITDRDITVRAVAQGLPPETRVGDVMSPEVTYCFDDDEVSQVEHIIGELHIHRLPVLNRSKHLVGIVSLADIAAAREQDEGNAAHVTLSERMERLASSGSD